MAQSSWSIPAIGGAVPTQFPGVPFTLQAARIPEGREPVFGDVL